jgi:hypothetical protein
LRPFSIGEPHSLRAAVDAMTAARALSIGRTMAYEPAKKGEFPCKVIRYGDTYRVPTAEILRFLNVPIPATQTTEKREMK